MAVELIFFVAGNEYIIIQLPEIFVNFGEKDIGSKSGAYPCKVQCISKLNCLSINISATDDEKIFIGSAGSDRIIPCCKVFSTRQIKVGLAGEYDIAALRQRFDRQRFPSTAAHQDCVAGSEFLEMFQIVGQMAQQSVLEAQFAILADSRDNTNMIHYKNFGKNTFFIRNFAR